MFRGGVVIVDNDALKNVVHTLITQPPDEGILYFGIAQVTIKAYVSHTSLYSIL